MSKRSKRNQRKARSAPDSHGVQIIDSRGQIVAGSSYVPSYSYAYQTGDKWNGGFGQTNFLLTDYWTLRARSRQLFEENLYARGLIRRLVTNEINTGLHLEATPEEILLGLEEDALADWSENVENRFSIWADNPRLCDVNERLTWGQIQAEIRRTSLVSGDVLVVNRNDSRTLLPKIQLIDGGRVQQPLDVPQGGNKIVQGVEIDSLGRHVAFWVRQDDGTSKRLPAWGEKSGRRLAWLVYGCDKQLEDTRGKPLLSLVLQSLKEIDRYRDSVQLKATINAMLAMFIKRDEDKPGTALMTGGAVRRTTEAANGPAGVSQEQRRFAMMEQHPGIVMEQLQKGETPHGFQSNGTDEKFGDFEAAIMSVVAWGNGVPPEILTLSFNSNYSASQAAVNEFKLGMNVTRNDFGASACQPVYVEWLISEALSGKIRANGFLEAWRDPKQYDIFGAWTSASWLGQIKPAVDQSKLVAGYEQQCQAGFMTRDQASRELNGSKYSKNVQKLKRENAALAEANEPLKKIESLTKPSAQQNESANPNEDSINKEDPLDADSATRSRKATLRVIT